MVKSQEAPMSQIPQKFKNSKISELVAESSLPPVANTVNSKEANT